MRKPGIRRRKARALQSFYARAACIGDMGNMLGAMRASVRAFKQWAAALPKRGK